MKCITQNELFSKIIRENYQEMQKRIKKLPHDDSIIGSSNFGKFLDYFSQEDDKWICEINDLIER